MERGKGKGSYNIDKQTVTLASYRLLLMNKALMTVFQSLSKHYSNTLVAKRTRRTHPKAKDDDSGRKNKLKMMFIS